MPDEQSTELETVDEHVGLPANLPEDLPFTKSHALLKMKMQVKIGKNGVRRLALGDETNLGRQSAQRVQPRSTELLSDKNRKGSLEYIDSFYDILDSPRRVRNEIVGRCRGKVLMERVLEAAQDPT